MLLENASFWRFRAFAAIYIGRCTEFWISLIIPLGGLVRSAIKHCFRKKFLRRFYEQRPVGNLFFPRVIGRAERQVQTLIRQS